MTRCSHSREQRRDGARLVSPEATVAPHGLSEDLGRPGVGAGEAPHQN